MKQKYTVTVLSEHYVPGHDGLYTTRNVYEYTDFEHVVSLVDLLIAGSDSVTVKFRKETIDE